ncbi:MAG: acetolactate decarboxylase [Apilactobacillus sp.]|uniref:acetolactate decarboxylase n=1 Tax=Apilactobacillus TaxID=2767877 RepID=UPI0025F0FFC7|nr:acetolactate decarboxylase [Apilactobacillus sp.]MCT6822696.1 acetolactate decarboxylase [Apilactobacillus sp.]MCT6858596.1 acetolactate decarboxylase [Apilactobacillus sp.]
MQNTTQLFQNGTGAIVVPGLFDGTLTIKELMENGNTGIGSGDGLDGELIIIDNKPYKIDGDGIVSIVNDDFTVPFGNAHFADYEDVSVTPNLNSKDMSDVIFKHKPFENTQFSIKLHGQFSHVTVRSVYKQTKPYPNLIQTAENEHVFEGDNVTGTIIGYYNPSPFSQIAVKGFHMHFIADDLSIGGHLSKFSGFNGHFGIQLFNDFKLRLPVQNNDFLNHNFSKDDIEGSINKTER